MLDSGWLEVQRKENLAMSANLPELLAAFPSHTGLLIGHGWKWKLEVLSFRIMEQDLQQLLLSFMCEKTVAHHQLARALCARPPLQAAPRSAHWRLAASVLQPCLPSGPEWQAGPCGNRPMTEYKHTSREVVVKLPLCHWGC